MFSRKIDEPVVFWSRATRAQGELLMLEQELIVPLVSHTPSRRAQYRPFTDFLGQVRRKTPMVPAVRESGATAKIPRR